MQPNATKIRFKDLIFSMAVGDVISFPIEKTINVRVTASNVGITEQRRYKTSINREQGIVSVKRLQ